MHELVILSALLESVEARAREVGARKVVAIELVVGERAGIVDDSLLFYFDQFTPGTLVEGAHLNVRRTPMRFGCEPCGTSYVPADADFACPACGQIGQVIDDGTALQIESIEIERET